MKVIENKPEIGRWPAGTKGHMYSTISMNAYSQLELHCSCGRMLFRSVNADTLIVSEPIVSLKELDRRFGLHVRDMRIEAGEKF